MIKDMGSKIERLQLLPLVIVVMLAMLFLVGCGNAASLTATQAPTATFTQEPPAATEAPQATSTPEPPVESVPLTTGDVAPDFTLPDSSGNMLHLADELLDNRVVILVFYHAHY